MVRMISKEEAVKMIMRGLQKHGFSKTHRSLNGSYYMGKPRQTPYKIRIACHSAPKHLPDVVHDIVMKNNTIVNDVDYQVKKAIEKFRYWENWRNK